MVHVLITERFALPILVQMQTHPQLLVTHDSQWYQKPPSQWQDIAVLLIRSQTRVDQKLLNHFPNLKLVVTATAGFNHIDLELCSTNQIQVAHCPVSHSASTAELTWALIHACSRRLLEAQQAVRRGDWDRNKLLGTELHGKTLGVVGLGRVGSRVAQVARAFGMPVLAFDPYQDDPVFQECAATRVSLEELLTQSDIVSLHVPLTRETWHLMGEVYLASLSSEALLINTCRGPVIHEKALVHCLRDHRIGAVGLDVYEYEPLAKDSPLFEFSNVITTPHIGASTREAFEKASAEAYAQVVRFLNQEPLPNSLPPQTPWYQAGHCL